jgi:hypothetical protein
VYPITITVVVAVVTFASGLVGFLLPRLLPAQYVDDSKGMVGSIGGLVTLLLALVLGLLVWASYGVYTNQNTESQSLGPVVLKLDFALQQYGPEARRGRDLVRGLVVRARERFWGGGTGTVSPYAQARADQQDIATFFASLGPATDEQRQLTAAAKASFAQVIDTTLLMTRQLATPVPNLLLFVVVGWSALLFLGYGLLGALNPVSVVAEALGAIAVASAIFMILEFSQPYSGRFGISPAGIDNLIAVLGR